MKHFYPNIFLLYFLLLASGSTWSAAKSTRHHTVHTHYHQPSLSFIHLIGARKGDSAPNIGEVKSYLRRFGYLNNLKLGTNRQSEDQFDELLERALLTYQGFFKLNKTGILDHDTISMMSKPRCRNPDMYNGPKRDGFNGHFQRHFRTNPGNFRRTKNHLYVKIDANISTPLKDAIYQAFADWEPYVPLKFLKTSDPKSFVADIKVRFFMRDHGDSFSFDGPNGMLAHADIGQGSKMHFDAEENWQVGAVDDAYDITTVARHEIGHLLGLQHSDVESALMYPTISMGTIKEIGDDDKAGILTLYYGS